MPIIGHVGRRGWKLRMLNIGIHVLLLLGALTMIYPLLMMLSGSVRSTVDERALSAVPGYFFDDEILFRKWVEARYNERTEEYALCHRRRVLSFETLRFPGASACPPGRVRQRYEDWNEFLGGCEDRLDEHCFSLAHAAGIGIAPEAARRFVAEARAEPDVAGDIARFNRKYGAAFSAWDQIKVPVLNLVRRSADAELTPLTRRIVEFTRRQPRCDRNYYSLDAFFVEQQLKPKYQQSLAVMNAALGTDYRSWAQVTLAHKAPADGLRQDWSHFVKKLLSLQFIAVSPEGRPAYQEFLRGRYRDISVLNARYGAAYAGFADVPLPAPAGKPSPAGKPAGMPPAGTALVDWNYFISDVADPAHLALRSVEFLWRDFLKAKYRDIASLSVAHRMGLAAPSDLALPPRLPEENLAREDDWVEFVERHADPDWVRPDFSANQDWVSFLTRPFGAGKELDLRALNAALDTRYESVEDIAVPLERPANPKLAERWRAFTAGACPRNLLVVDVPKAEARWHEFIRGKYATVQELNRRYGWLPDSFDAVAMPAEEIDYYDFRATQRHVFREFLTRNYVIVFQTLFTNGRAVLNTVIYCALAILTALIVNPLAAYALSRYKPPSQYKLLLFLMLTMAFPSMVLGIPNFLLLRRLGLLNSFAALILPGMANGYLIFLLKGFFDSLPRELYESAQMDGASEWTMFWQITMATSKPILAVVALGAFTAAYGNFTMAFILCQDPKMWTMMVQIYQLQQFSCLGVTFAAIVIAAIPTLLVFVFCQNIIMRGIVVPTEK